MIACAAKSVVRRSGWNPTLQETVVSLIFMEWRDDFHVVRLIDPERYVMMGD